MSNWPLLIAIPIGLWQIRRARRLAQAFYRIQQAARNGADALEVLRAAAQGAR